MAAFARRDFSGEYALNRSVSVLEHHGPGSPTPSSLEWEGETLVFEHASDAPEAPMTMSWRYDLDGSRRRLTARETLRAPGYDQDNVWVFDRVEP